MKHWKYMRTFETLADLIGNPQGKDGPTPSVVSLAKYVKLLRPLEQQIINFYYRDGLTLKRISDLYGLSIGRVLTIKSRAIRTMRIMFIAER